jgi:tryptophanyl-tRNA synthetase
LLRSHDELEQSITFHPICQLNMQMNVSRALSAATKTVVEAKEPKWSMLEGKTVFSAIQPTGVCHVGNYLGALSAWTAMARTAPATSQLIFATADLHAITIPKDPKSLKEWRRLALASIIAAGVDPNRCLVYHQSSVPEHTQLYWILSTLTGMGYLNRMTQWKSKTGVSEQVSLSDMSPEVLSQLNLGLFAYPSLQCADILVHKAHYVPVGEDQTQHLELTRYVTKTFNRHYGNIFPTPSTILTPFRKVLSLRDPAKKMSKSDPAGCVYITDSPDEIKRKIRKAVTDSMQGPITYDPDARPGVSNLLSIASGLLDVSPATLLADKFSYIKDHKDLKDAVADVLINVLAPIRTEFQKLVSEPHYLDDIARKGAESARASASATIDEVYEAVGFDSAF